MELLDLRDELRDIWLWLGDDDWLLARSHVAPVPLTLFPIAAEAATDVIADVEQEAAPAPLIVPAWVTITNGWTDAPMLPVNPINFFQFLLPKDPNYWQLLLSFIATPHIQEIFHFRNVSNQIMKKGREEEWTDGGRRERKKERSWNGRWKEIALELLLSGCAFCWRGILFFLRLVFIGNFFFETQKRRRRRKKKKKREKCNWFSNDRLVERRSLRAGDRSLQTPKAESEATPSATTTIFFFFWGGFGFDGNGGEKKMRKKLYNSITDTLIRGGTCGFATIIWFSSSSFFFTGPCSVGRVRFGARMAGAASAEAAQSFGESVKPFGQSLKRPTLFREACRDVLYGTGRRCGAGRSGFCKSRQIADRAGGIVRRNRGASSRRAQHGHVLSYQKKIIKKKIGKCNNNNTRRKRKVNVASQWRQFRWRLLPVRAH